MFDLFVPVYESGWYKRLEHVYTIEELPLLGLMLNCKESTTRARRENGKYYKIHYLELPCAFDIETTNIYQRNEKGQIDNAQRPFSFMYHWQMCIDRYVVFGRTWEQWLRALEYISDNMHLSMEKRLVIYVHNLPFEFQFFRRFVTVVDGFYRDPYKPLKVVLNNGIEFRDSQALSNMSLDAFCKNSIGCIHRKAAGDLDYDVIRTAATPLSEKEQGYCYNDVAGLAECIRAKMRDDTLAHMPMTSTGYVRRDCRNSMRKNKKNRRMFLGSQLSPDVYRMFKSAFRGGNTHANAARAGKTINGPVYSYDITSSYPAVMMEEEYPAGAFSSYDPGRQAEQDPEMEKYCYIFELLLVNPRYKGSCGIPYISISKCSHYTEVEGWQEDNGRIRSAAYIEMTVLDVDWKIIKETYSFDSYHIRNMYAAQKAPLPAEFKSVVMDYFRQKTTLKGLEDPDSVYLYGKYKNLLNACFGMTTTRLDMDIIQYKPHAEPEYQSEGKPLEELLEKFYKSRNSFLPYQWGVYHSICPQAP